MLHHHHNERPFEYNEIVVDTRTWASNLPEFVVAFFFLRRPGLSKEQREGGEQQARDVHRRFLQRYPGAQTPLVALDTTKEQDAFTMA